MSNFIKVILFSIVSSSAFANIDLDPSLVRPWNQTEKSQFPTPLGAAFKREDRTLIFIGDHHSDPAATYKYIQMAFKKVSPEIAVVEGLNFSEGENPKVHMDRYVSKSKEEIWKDPSLGPGTELLAMSHNIAVIGGEPSIQEEMTSSFLLGKGFRPDDIRNVQIVQRIPYRRDKLKMTDPDVFFDYALKLYDVKDPKSVFKTKFLKWYRKRVQREFDYSKITKSDTAVNCEAGDSFLQEVACAININRDRSLVEHVGILLKKYHRVLVTYGTGHFVQEYPAYLSAFVHPPEYIKLESVP